MEVEQEEILVRTMSITMRQNTQLTNFSQKKKNRWEIVIKPKDVSDVRELYLTIFNNGRASLGVNSSNRESISFNGIVREGNPINKKAF